MICKGKYNKAVIHAGMIDASAYCQIENLMDQKWAAGSSVRIMPDVHAGAGCVIGFTMTVEDKICPNLVGVDIGCGMHVVDLGNRDIDYAELDRIVREYVPSGHDVHEQASMPSAIVKRTEKIISSLRCKSQLHDVGRIICSVGTLGGGNHFIEIDRADDGHRFLVIHSGSRSLGLQVAQIYQKKAIAHCSTCPEKELKEGIECIRKNLKAAKRQKEIPMAIEKLKAELKPEYVPDELAYIEGADSADYLHDVKLCQEYAMLNRAAMADAIIRHLFGCAADSLENFTTMHNYIGDDGVLRKGAISLKKDEIAIIPINMAEGSLIVRGKGNPDYNFSGPHGAGRRFSRSDAKELIGLDEFRESMKDVWTTSVSESTIDESPMAYKSLDDIVPFLEPTADVICHAMPEYNFKA